MKNISIQEKDHTLILCASGQWTIFSLNHLDHFLRHLSLKAYTTVVFETEHLEDIDTAGAWIIYHFLQRCKDKGISISTPNLHKVLGELFEKFPQEMIQLPKDEQKAKRLLYLLEIFGYRTSLGLRRALELLSFLGEVIIRFFVSSFKGSFPLKPLFVYMEYTGLRALPIVGIMSFLIGIVLIYQAVFQLRRFGAEIFAVDMLAISMSREIAILITAIIVAGRSGSAFTAQIGTMKLNQEIDALRVLGMNPVEILVIPRVVALILTLPLLAFYALVMGLLGGALMCYFSLEMSIEQYMHQLSQALTLSSFMVGMVKAPFFAFIIALVGCFEGLKVSGGAASVGQRTTRSVVESIFLVIIFNAIFSVIFTYMGV